MLRHWLRAAHDHNHTRTKLTVPKHGYFKVFWPVIFLAAPVIIALDFSSYGFVNQLIPNLPAVQRDRENLLLRRRCFDTLIMAHNWESSQHKCRQRSLF